MYFYPEKQLGLYGNVPVATNASSYVASNAFVSSSQRAAAGSGLYGQYALSSEPFVASSQIAAASHSVFNGYTRREEDDLGYPFTVEAQKMLGMGVNPASEIVPGFNRANLNSPNRPLRVGHLNAALLPAGIESWFSSLIRHCNPQVLHFWRHVSTTQVVDTRVTQRLGVPVEIGTAESCRTMAQNSDVVLISDPGIEPARVASWFAGIEMPLTIFVAHGDGNYTSDSLTAFQPLADHIVAISDHVRETICAEIPCSVILNGVNPETLCQTQPRETTRENLGFSEADFVVGIVGRFSPEKNIPLLAEAVARLPCHVKLLIVGFGHQREELISVGMRLLPGRFVILEGDRFLGDLYRAMDTHVLPSSTEGYGLVTMEAMMCGVPAVATNLGAAYQLIENGVNGFIVQQDSVDIAQRLDYLRRNPGLRNTIAAQGRQTAEAHGYASVMARKYEQLIVSHWQNRQHRVL